MADLKDLTAALWTANGADADIDRAIAEHFAVSSADFSSSIDQCRTLIAERLPGWRLHIGYAANGIFPYVSLAKGDEVFVAEAPTVPLAILRAVIACPISSR
ncbi:MAG TPA: hypothetical protein VN809_12455 [Telmatospirillum sp.]|nr:hypothetical protein [Telmatospirillum sp.]